MDSKENPYPEFARFIRPLIEVLRGAGGSGKAKDISDLVIKSSNLSKDELDERLTNGELKVRNQIAWARQYAVFSELIDSSERGVWTLTRKGDKAPLEEYNIVEIVRIGRQKKKNWQSEVIMEKEISSFTSPSLNVKEKFLNYLRDKVPQKSGKPNSYAKAMEVIEEVFFTPPLIYTADIWAFITLENIDSIYEVTLEEQKKDDGIFSSYTPSSYWKNSYCSAALKEFKEFLKKNSKTLSDDSTFEREQVDFTLDDYKQSLASAHLKVPSHLPARFIAALQTKPFVILTGLAGSGKTKLAEAFSMWISETEAQYCMVSVGADWTNREPLLGFPDALNPGCYVKPDCGALDLILRAVQNPEKPYFLILDEMNMSHVERYFADFLSAMESAESRISLHSDWSDLRKENSEDTISDSPTGTAEELPVPASLQLPKNLFVIGTVNIDETTYMFSPKVLDRANVIEFRVSKEEMTNYFEEPKELDMECLKGKGAGMGYDFVAQSLQKGKVKEGLEKALIPFFIKLQEAGAEFGYRTAAEISRFAAICEELADKDLREENGIIDAAILQKLLPKVHGSRNKIEKILKTLGQLCLKEPKAVPFTKEIEKDNIHYPLSYEKLERMHRRVVADGFTSFAEA